MAMMTRMGEISIPPKLNGILRLMGYRTGSVTEFRNRTIGLYGSGFTQEITALPMMIHIYRLKPISRIFATAIRKLDKMNIISPFINPNVA